MTHFDEFIDQLLTEDRVCDIILPRLTQRSVLEETEGLPPRKSLLVRRIDVLSKGSSLLTDLLRTRMRMRVRRKSKTKGDPKRAQNQARNDSGCYHAHRPVRRHHPVEARPTCGDGDQGPRPSRRTVVDTCRDRLRDHEAPRSRERKGIRERDISVGVRACRRTGSWRRWKRRSASTATFRYVVSIRGEADM